jgi:hypothetical protein
MTKVGAVRACRLESPTNVITLTKVATIDNMAAKPAPPHFTKLFLTRKARRLDQANSAAIVIDVVKPSKPDMVHLQKH